jgi:hypothetical protein
MSLANLFYLKETFRENMRRWRRACFRQRVRARREKYFALEALEPRVLLSATPTDVVALTEQAGGQGALTTEATPSVNLDVDGNGLAEPLTDGRLIFRYLSQFAGPQLIGGNVLGAGATRTTADAIIAFLDQAQANVPNMLDVDGNGLAEPLTDGRLIFRYLSQFAGPQLIGGNVLGAGATRTSADAIIMFLDQYNPVLDHLPPVMTAQLAQDTGLSATDGITFNPTMTGTLTDPSGIATFTAGFDDTPVGSFTSVMSDLLSTGSFTLSTARINQLAGGTLTDGPHTLHLRATDASGNLATLDKTFILDTLAPASPFFDLAVTSDTGTLGDQQTTAAIVTLKGETDANTSIQLVGTSTGTLSNGTGAFQLPDLALAVGANLITLRASDVAGNHTDFTRTLTRLAATAQADVVLEWNQIALEAIRLDASKPPVASRGMAMVSLAMYDAINAIEGMPGYYVGLSAQPGTSPEAAAAAAAHRVLSYLYPGQQTLFDTQLAASLASIPDGAAKTNGIALGQSIADAIIAIRATDGWNDFIDYVPGNQPGKWQPTAPMFDVALLPQWADLTPFALTSPNQFRPAGPPALTSQAYTDAFNEVKALGSATGSTRTADQTEIARFWADGPGTYTPPGHWNQIAAQIALEQGNSLSANARLFAQLNVALADAAITAWNTKYHFEFWRPITAIQQADTDGNAATIADPTWTPFLLTPPFSEYIPGHSTFSGAAAEILTSVFGANVAFTTASVGLLDANGQPIQRSFTSFEQAAQEAGRSRIYGGLHFEFSNQDGLTAGEQIARFVLDHFTVTTDTQAPKILLNQQNGTVSKTNLTLMGQVLDNLSGVAALQAKLDQGAFAPVTFDAAGRFSLPTTLALDGTADGLHTVTFEAMDYQGNSSTRVFTFTLDTHAPVITLTSPADSATLTVGTRLTGTADATGSRLVELCYQFDNGTVVPVSFDPTTGSFDAPLDLSRLAVGSQTLNLRAQDQAGNITTMTRTVTLAAPIPLTIIGVTPQQGTSDVGATFRPQVVFSRPINPGSLNANNFYATDSSGTRLAATIVPSQDGTFAWLFFTNPMPGASTITLHVDGTTIFAAGDGQALDANADGTPGGVFTSTFSTVSLVPLQGTTLSGKVLDPGPDLLMGTFDDIRAGADGVLHTTDDVFLNPIAGATVYILGLESQAVVTDAQGNFHFDAVPSGTIKLAIDGRTATNAPAGFFFPEMVMDLQIEVGQANTVMGTMGTREERAANLTRPEVYLPRLQTSILQTVSNNQPTMVTVNATAAPNLTDQQRQFLTLEVQPGSLIGPNGQPLTNGQVGISTVPPELVRDMLPPGLLQHTFDITIQAPDAAAFSTPLQMTFPNVFNAAPGTKLNFLSFDHTTGRLVIDGTATVSADGLSVTTDPGTGITKPGWHGGLPPSVTTTPPKKKFFIRRPTVPSVIGVRGLVGDVTLSVGDFTITPSAVGNPGEFQIDLRFLDDAFTLAQRESIMQAARRWEQVIVGDVPDIVTDVGLTDDLVVDIASGSIDGSGGVLATASSKYLRPTTLLPARGIVTFDSADLLTLENSGRLFNAALHEFGHVLGIGTIWDQVALLREAPNGGSGFVGSTAVIEFNRAFGTNLSFVPVEWGGSSVTREGHWSEAIFNQEAMTGSIDGGPNPVSRITVASLADLGYTVNLDNADTYIPLLNGDAVLRELERGNLSFAHGDFEFLDWPAFFRADFGTDNSPVASGYTAITPLTMYEGMRGYGWLSGSGTVIAGDRGSDNSLARDFNATSDATFVIDVPNGWYRLTLGLGDPIASYNQMEVYAEGLLIGNTSTMAGELAEPSYKVLVTDGQLTLRFSSLAQMAIYKLDLAELEAVTDSVTSSQVTTGRFMTAIEDVRSGFMIRGTTNLQSGGSIFPTDVVLAPNTNYRMWVLDIDTLAFSVSPFRTPPSGAIVKLPDISLFGDNSPDLDGDGLTNIAEFIAGTKSNARDSDADGLSDLSEIQQGLDPLGARSFPTGVVSILALRGTAKEVALEGSTRDATEQVAYVATGSSGLAIVEVSDFRNPLVLSQLQLVGDSTDVSVDSQFSIAAVASNSGGLHFVNVSDWNSPTVIRTIAVAANQVEVADGFAYVTVGGDLRSYNLLTGELVQSVTLSTGSLVGLAREGNTLYTTDNLNVLRATTTVAGVLTPRDFLTIPLVPGQSAGKVFVGNGVAYIGAQGNFSAGFTTADVSNPDDLVLLSGVDAANIQGRRIVANGSDLGVAVGNVRGPQGPIFSLDVVSLADPTNTGNFLARFALPAEPFSVAIAAGIAFVADGTGGLQVVNYRSFDNQGVAPTVSITSPVFDVDPLTPGIQVIEGAAIPVRVNAADDVQVRNVEMLVNGVVVTNDVSFPFELSALAVGSALSSGTTTVQVRATDTGGNVGLSNMLTFQLVPDTFPPTLVSSNVMDGAIKDKTFRTIQLQFSEPLEATKVTAQNFQLLNPVGAAVAPTAIQLLSGGAVVQLTYDPLSLGTHQFVIKSANVTDVAGNPFGAADQVISFQIVSNVVPTLNPLPPLGSRMYAQTIAGQIDAPLGSDTFTIFLDAGQKLTVGVAPDSASLRPRIELLDSNGNVLGAAESTGAGLAVSMQAVQIPTTAIYTLRVQGISGTGPFRSLILLNALEETEFFGEPKNDTLATATALDSSSLALQGPADRMAVLGIADGGDDFYRVDLAQGQVMFALLTALGGGDIGLELRDGGGNVLTIGQAGSVPGISEGIFAFQAPTAGAYYLNVTGLPDPDDVIGLPEYSLVVTRSAAQEYLPNDTLQTAQAFPLTGQAAGSVGTRVLPQVGVTVPDAVDYYSFIANAGDLLQITTTTPGEGTGEPANTLDPALQLFDPAGTLVASDLNGAADGRNAVITATAAGTGQYKIAVLPTAGGGDYTVRVTGATGQPTFNFQVASSAIRTNATQATAVLSFTIPPLLSSVSPGDVTINGIVATSFDVVDALTLRFHASGVAPVGGGYTVDLPAGAIQDLHGNGNPAFSRLFTGDTIAPVVTASSINALSVIQPNAPGTFTPLTVTFTFSEPIDQGTLSPDDVQLRRGIATDGFDGPSDNAATLSYNTALNQLTAVFNSALPTNGLMTLTLLGGSTGIRDLAGNPLNGSPNFPLPSGQGHPAIDNYVVEFGVGPATPSLEPFDADPPTGSLLFFGRELVSTFATAGETDVWTVDLKSGQTMGISLTPTSGIQGRLTVVDPNGVALATKSGALGRPVAIGDIPIATAGTYRIEVTSLSGVGVYSVGFALDTAFDVEFPVLNSPATNNTISTAQSLAVSTIPLQETASRLAAEGIISSSFDADLYSFDATAGQVVTLFVKDFSLTATPTLQLLKADGALLASGTLAIDGTVRISDYVVSEAGTYLARVTCFDGTPEYNLVVTRGATFERAGNSVLAQDLTRSGQVLGGLDKQGKGVNGSIRVGVLGGAGAASIVSQLNDDTWYDFDAMVVTADDIDTLQELNAYDVIVVGDPASRVQLQTIEQTLNIWFGIGQGGLVGVGGLVQAAGPSGGFALGLLDSVIPINLTVLSTEATNPTLAIASTPHEVTQGLSSFTVDGKVERPSGNIDQNAVLLGTTNGAPGVVAYDQGESEIRSRSAFIGPMYFDSTATGLRSGAADRLLEQTIAWASHVDIMDAYWINANAGDQLTIRTTTPFAGPRLPQNLLDPRLELLNPQGTVVASNDNGAPDGKNALINYTVPNSAGGQYTVRVRGGETGEYTLAVTGATGTASTSSENGLSVETAGTSLATGDSGLSSGLAYVQSSWIKDFVTNPSAVEPTDEEELVIELPALAGV